MASSWVTAGLASRGRRLMSAAVAIVIGVAFLTTSLGVLITAQRGMEDAVGAGLRDAALVVSGVEGQWVEPEVYDEIAGLPEVTNVRGETMVMVEAAPRNWLTGAPMPAGGVSLLSGQTAVADGEIVVNPELAQDVAVGEELVLDRLDFDEGSTEPVTLRVVGIADFGDTNPSLSYGPVFVANDATLRQLDPMLAYRLVMVDLADGTSEAAAREALAGTWSRAEVRTGPEVAAERVTQMTGGTNVMGAILLGFGAVALATAAIVIANTFTITLAQRTGELALLRAVGATKRQVRRVVLAEAVLLGLVASAIGVVLGLVGAQGLVWLGGRFDLGIPMASVVAITPVILFVPLLVGALVTVMASLWPAVRATRVSPLAALRPAGESSERRRVGWIRLALAAVLVGVGVAAMVFAATNRDILSGVAGGLLSFVGVLVAAVVVVPAAVRMLGLGARVAGVPGRLAVDNAVRNPGRAAATSAALLVGVTLITMTSIGAASAERTAMGEIDSAFAVDFMVETSSEYVEVEAGAAGEAGEAGAVGAVGQGQEQPAQVSLPLKPDTEARLQQATGVETARAVETAYLSLDEAWAPTLTLGLDPQRDGDVVRGTDLQELVPGTVGMSNDLLAMHGLEAGDTIALHGAGGSGDFTVVKLAVGYQLALNEADLTKLGGDNVVHGAALIRLAADADAANSLAAIQEIADEDGSMVDGAAFDRALIGQMLSILVLVTTALLGVAVLIAVVGIANTLSLSVVERHHEHALLRGLGLTRAQMQVMLLVEGVLLAVVSALIGLLLGLGYATLGVQTVLPEGTQMQLAVPWAQVALIVVVAVVAGVLSSVLPARRAAKVSPAAGLAAA